MHTYRESAHLLKAMAHPIRLEILDIVCRSDECVCHLSAALNKPQPYVSQQLAILRNAGLIVDRKDGNLVFYGLAAGPAAAQVAEILGATRAGAEAYQDVGHKRAPGCTCPKCEQDGVCSNAGVRAQGAGPAPSRG